MRVGIGMGPATRAPVRLVVSTISPADWSNIRWSKALNRILIFCPLIIYLLRFRDIPVFRRSPTMPIAARLFCAHRSWPCPRVKEHGLWLTHVQSVADPTPAPGRKTPDIQPEKISPSTPNRHCPSFFPTPRFFHPLEKIFPIIGKPPKLFSNHWKNRSKFSNHWPPPSHRRPPPRIVPSAVNREFSHPSRGIPPGWSPAGLLDPLEPHGEDGDVGRGDARYAGGLA